jgi:hypothetical protein
MEFNARYIRDDDMSGRSNDFYIYQECGTPISDNEVDNTQRQWAYVKWSKHE